MERRSEKKSAAFSALFRLGIIRSNIENQRFRAEAPKAKATKKNKKKSDQDGVEQNSVTTKNA